MNILLTPELEQFVNERVEKGEYTDALSVITAGLRLLSERELKREVMIGIEQLERGDRVDGREVMKRLQEKNQQLVGSQQ